MDIAVKNLVLSYETLANQAIKFNHAYLQLLKIYEELILAPDWFAELEKSGSSPFKTIASMQQEQKIIVSKFQDLSKFIAKAQLHFIINPEAEQLKNIAHDCQIMIDFVNSIDLADLQDMFVKIKK
ncbi:MAG: hypothetical protein HEQ27_01935 [Dolichospermum sp. JUN01]|uniref:hypothetical protein n=1 Tax=Anabaena sp. AL09 TaxID=1710891 RepID=UPI0007FF6CDB|nr:hypothetical protein [Anabaena sp. AL09]MBJ7298495.1 hypothetical protein [Dolichospermum sp.]MBO1055342.1 hypothetical protein [Dolichospermum sp. JUN01]OBQ01957.1 MAG: hypothetical protein AN490_19655 [Anabaena sp. AL09]OBQ03637.1 MAG: hypothetical protein AN482_19420 [Anabaena sp. LE011-02]